MVVFIQILLTSVLAGALFYLYVNRKLHCPKCRRVFAATISKKKLVKEKTVEQVVWNDKKAIDEVKELSLKTMKYQYTCKYCQHKWKHKKEEF
ncbi:MAG: hypothetical protein ACPG19_10200 [Saprospiraceae bacterium]